MADELTLGGSLAYADSEDTDIALAISGLLATVSTKRVALIKQSVGTSEEALDLGDVGTLGYIFIVNRDATNYVQIKTATSGTLMVRLNPGQFALFRFGSGVTAPFIIADTAACQVEYLLISA